MDDFKTHLPIIQTLGNPGMKPRHWEKISDIVGFPIVVDDELSLEKVIDFNLVDYIEKFESISEAATKENNLEKALDKMMKEWADLRFDILPYKLVFQYGFWRIVLVASPIVFLIFFLLCHQFFQNCVVKGF